ncbi:hypothetical protein K438DRAFT_1888071 [Mycena galopus ATCC 62051]|nr:hypothetical protein K438DRAFT_1888071 [Mycena galopus ATCC 62051]
MHGEKSCRQKYRWQGPAQADPSKSSAACKSTLRRVHCVMQVGRHTHFVRPVIPTRFPAPWLPHWLPHAIQHCVDITRHPVCLLLPACAHGAEQRRRHAPYGPWGACMKMPIGVPWCGTLPTVLGMSIASAGIGIASTVLVIERPASSPHQKTRCSLSLPTPGAIHPCAPCPSPRPHARCFPPPMHAPPSLGSSSPC